MWGWNIKKLSLTEEDGNIVLILDQCLKGAGSDVLNLVNTMIFTVMNFRIDGFLLAYERVLPFKTMSVIVTAFLFISGVYEQMTSLQWGKGETTPFHIFCSRVTGDQGKIWTRILACCQLWSQFLRFFTSTAQPYFKDAQVKSLQENGQIGGEGGFWWKRKLISNLARQVEGFRRCQEVENCRGGCQFALRNA